jgi:hypothetical protein
VVLVRVTPTPFDLEEYHSAAADWERDDPEAVRIWRGQAEPGEHDAVPLLEGRTALDNESAQQVRRAEWLALIGPITSTA